MLPVRFHGSIGVSAYHDLLRLLQDEAILGIRGAPTRVEVKGRGYWYDKYRLGSTVAQRYIGPDSADLRERLNRSAEILAERPARRAHRMRLVRLLRAEGFASTDRATGSLLAGFATAGVFRLGGTLVGTVAFRHYEGELGLALALDDLARTDDIDVASFERLSIAIGDKVDPDLAQVFATLAFRPVPSLEPGKTWRWAQAASGTIVEFLKPAHRDEGIRDLPALGVSAQALRHLDFLLADPVPAASLYRSGILIQIPRPERFAIHKLIVAERRQGGPDALKARKDRAQARLLIHALAETRPDELLEALVEARGRGERWRERIEASLRRLPDCAAVLAGLC